MLAKAIYDYLSLQTVPNTVQEFFWKKSTLRKNSTK